jgi:hypothetical protein
LIRCEATCGLKRSCGGWVWRDKTGRFPFVEGGVSAGTACCAPTDVGCDRGQGVGKRLKHFGGGPCDIDVGGNQRRRRRIQSPQTNPKRDMITEAASAIAITSQNWARVFSASWN